MTYDYITSLTSPNHSGRRTKRVTSITIHHWGIDGQRFDSVARYLCRAGGNSSAHYVAQAGKVACIVDPDNIAWHAGNYEGNQTSIGIECRPEATDDDYATVAELIAALRKVYGDIPLRPHRYWKSTACPGRWDLARLDRLARGTKAPAIPVNNPKPAPKPPVKPSTGLALDGFGGAATVRRWQQVMGTTVDGVISGQGLADRPYHVRLETVQYARGGSNLVRAVQRAVGVTADGYLGPNTIRAIQRRLGVAVDGYFGPGTVVALQKRLNGGKF